MTEIFTGLLKKGLTVSE